MQELSFVLFQIDQARRYIQEGLDESLRLALVLLDNSIELQLDRRIRSDSLLERLRESSFWMRQQVPAEQQPTLSSEDDGWMPLTRREKRAIQRYFDPKVTNLSKRQSYFDSSIALVLRRLHRYRNEAYHRAAVRRPTRSCWSSIVCCCFRCRSARWSVATAMQPGWNVNSASGEALA